MSAHRLGNRHPLETGCGMPENFAELEALCGEIEEEGLIPGVAGTLLTGNTFSAVFNLAKTDWLTTPEGLCTYKYFCCRLH